MSKIRGTAMGRWRIWAVGEGEREGDLQRQLSRSCDEIQSILTATLKLTCIRVLAIKVRASHPWQDLTAQPLPDFMRHASAFC